MKYKLYRYNPCLLMDSFDSAEKAIKAKREIESKNDVHVNYYITDENNEVVHDLNGGIY